MTVTCGGEVTVTVAHVRSMEAMEVVRWSMVGAVTRKSSMVAGAWIEVAIDRAMEVVRAVEPWTGTDEDTAVKPLRAVIAVGCAVVGRVVIVAVRADRRVADVYAD